MELTENNRSIFEDILVEILNRTRDAQNIYPVHCRSKHCHSAVLNIIVVGVTDPKTRLPSIREHVRAVIISQSFYQGHVALIER